MSNNTLLRTLALAVALFTASAPATAGAASTQTATGTSTVTVTVPDVIILDYFSNINLALAGQTESHPHTSYTQTGISGGDQDVNGTGYLAVANLADANSSALKGSDLTLTMKNVWAIRGFSSSGNATVSISGPASNTLTKSGTTSTVGISALKVMVDGAAASSAATSITAALKGIQKSGATMGDVLLGLNFTNTSVSGDYTGTITITAVTM